MQALYYGRQRKPTDAVPGPEDGVCLAYRTDRLERISSRAVRLADLVPALAATAATETGGGGRAAGGGGRAAGGGGGSKFWEFVAQREDGAVLALLRDKQASARARAVRCFARFGARARPLLGGRPTAPVARAAHAGVQGDVLLAAPGCGAPHFTAPILSAPIVGP